MKMITGFKSAFVAGLALVMLAVLPVSAAESPGEELSGEELVIEDPGQESDGEQFLPPEEQADQIQEKRTGSICVQLTEGKDGVLPEGLRVDCIRIADIEQGEYILEEAYGQSGIDLNQIENSEQLDTVAESLAELASGGTSVATDGQGYAVFRDLEVGVYLIRAEKNVGYDIVTPTLVAVPTWNEEAGEMSYDIEIIPKHTPRPDTVETANEAPQTNLNDNTGKYLACAVGCLALASILRITGRRKRAGAR